MAKPVILAVDDDISVLEAVVQDLRRQYAAQYRILRAGSGQAALDTCTQLKQRGDAVALFLSDQRMPGMSGVEFLEKAQAIYPDARRALLTAYADTEAAIKAINTAKINYYLTKPWDPPEEKLYPVLDDLLENWSAGYKPPFEGLRVVGPRWSARDHEVRDFLSRNQVPYVWLDPEQHDEAVRLLEQYQIGDGRLPAVLFPDGSSLVQPTRTELAARVGLRTQAEKDFYDVAIIGAGPAGLAAAVYAASEGLRAIVIEPDAPGGQAGSSSRIENYLGFPSGLSGADLARRAYAQASRFGAEFLTQSATAIRTQAPYHFVQLADGREISCHIVLVATGVAYRKLNIPGIEKFTGAGVYYGAALAEALSCRDEEIYIVGGANSAGQAAVHFARYARKVTMLVRADSLEKSMSKYLINQITGTSNIEVLTGAEVQEVAGDGRLECLKVRNRHGEMVCPASALFIFIGAEPKTEWLPENVMRDPRGFVLSGNELRIEGKMPRIWKEDRPPFLLETSTPGIFVAGDVRHGSVKRVASAVGEGSISVQFMHQYLARF
ncbi:FAD-dependent oxidoreductase [Pseudacidobacterium ailaaui]|jgi:thioredoxin reductase (NADPH)|uniref:FAD-dependent oxidoreductase n=1 Tax=Pseudacidobacterium ailaaui TaxID=1382359 RepID=UPI00047D38DD|nr:FAD-dependent oxidoreductase [Pseudacidobacterium ailaaui]